MNYAPEMTTTALKMLLSLGIVLALVWGLYRLARRNLPGIQAGPRGKLIQVLASLLPGRQEIHRRRAGARGHSGAGNRSGTGEFALPHR